MNQNFQVENFFNIFSSAITAKLLLDLIKVPTKAAPPTFICDPLKCWVNNPAVVVAGDFIKIKIAWFCFLIFLIYLKESGYLKSLQDIAARVFGLDSTQVDVPMVAVMVAVVLNGINGNGE